MIILVPHKDAGCNSDDECPLTETCRNRACVNPCLDSSCAKNADCVVNNHKSSCVCKNGLVGNPFINCYQAIKPSTPECTSDYQCLDSQACINRQCVQPCTESNPCAGGAECRVSNHRPLCACPQGWGGDPKVQCYKRKYFHTHI